MIAKKEEFLAKVREREQNRTSSENQSTGLKGQYTEEPPNILIITADDLGLTDMSLYGGPHVDTPHMDAIGTEGVIFTDAYCTSPICSPSRASMLTGRYQQRYGYEVQPQNRYPRNRLEYYVFKFFIDTGNWVLVEQPEVPRKKDIAKQGLPPSEITLAELLEAGGYETGIIGKWHLGFNDPFIPNNRGFDYQYGFYEAFSLYAPVDHPDIVNYRHDYFANKHIWKQERKGPCAIRRNHEIIEEDEYLTTRIAEEAVRYLRDYRDNRFFLNVSFSAPHTPFQAPEKYVDMFSHVEDKNKRVYYAMIKALDDGVGMIMHALEELGLEENTIVMFASDNGGATYTGATDNAPLKGGKFTNFEGGLSVPCMMRWKGVLPEGMLYEHPVSLLDFFNTAAAVTDIGLPDDRVYDGVDLIPYLTGEKLERPHDALFWRAGYNKAVRKGPWKLIIDEKAGRTLLYNLEADRTEQNNLAEEQPDIVRELKQVLSEWEKELMEPLWPRVMDYRFTIDGEEFMFAL
jgi:arylsulfatase A-like enzyme